MFMPELHLLYVILIICNVSSEINFDHDVASKGLVTVKAHFDLKQASRRSMSWNDNLDVLGCSGHDGFASIRASSKSYL